MDSCIAALLKSGMEHLRRKHFVIRRARVAATQSLNKRTLLL